MKVRVYRNFHRKYWSVQHFVPEKKGWRLWKHMDEIVLHDVEWVVQPGGLKRVRETGQKNVHAYAKGTLVLDQKPTNEALDTWASVWYDPFKQCTFHANGKSLHESKYAYFAKSGKVQVDGLQAP